MAKSITVSLDNLKIEKTSSVDFSPIYRVKFEPSMAFSGVNLNDVEALVFDPAVKNLKVVFKKPN
mgnify:CR=1 FL=1